ncbi:Methyl-CpG-binding domain-containing protein 2 [Abeliophyllum distichum]|uniref:Methyl-CpG-binding domain-containing protein 2 n=1 Tax=Abeliophyllum distichum TaxID=126358 RepID=A0ABD1VAW1_9LAMI
MLPQSLKLTVRLNREQNKVNDSTAPNHLISMEGEPNISNSSTLVASQETTPQDHFSSKEREETRNVGDEENQTENAQNQLVLYDPAVANSARGIEAVPDSIAHQPPSFSRFPFSNQTSRVLPSVGAFTVQCANCFKWRLIPSKAKYEEIREYITENPFLCETAREWRSDVSCDDPPDILQDESRLWAIDKPNIAQPPRGWERLLRIRGEGSSKFADVYYVAPTGKRLRSMVEIQKYLDKHPEYIEEGVTMSQFSFQIPRPLQENYVRKRPPHSAPSQDATDHRMPVPLDPSKAIKWVGPDEDTNLQPGGGPGLSTPYFEAPILEPERQPAKKKRTLSKRRFNGNLIYNQNEVSVEQSPQL